MIPTQITRSQIRRRFAVAVRLALAFVAIWFVATQVDVGAILDAARHADSAWIAVALVLLPANILLEAMTWRPILQCVVGRVSVPEALIGVLSGYPVGIFTPGRIGDFAGRALSIDHGEPSQIGLSAAVARLPDLAAILLVGTITLVVGTTAGVVAFPRSSVLIAGSTAALLVVLSAVFMPRVIHHVAARILRPKRLRPNLKFLTKLSAAVMGRVFVLSLARLAVYSSQFMLLAFAFSPDIRIVPTATAVLLTFLAKSVVPPITFLDLGVREGAAAFFFGLLGLGSAVGFDAALMLFGINIALPAVLAVPLIARLRVPSRAGPRAVSPSEIRV